MLYLNPPFFVIDGVSLFPDHADPLQYYFLPMMPRLTLGGPDGKVPQLQLIKYRGKAGTGGFLNFDVNVGIDPDDLADVARQLRNAAKLDDLPRLAPVPLVDGTVKLLILGAESADAPDPNGKKPAAPVTPAGAAPAAGPRFVVKIQNSVKPSLYGDDQATFSVQLDQDGVVLLDKALQGDMAPIGVVYSLDFLALRPAYSVRLKVDWDRVQKHLDENFGTSFLCVSTDVDKAVDQLVESKAIEIEADTFVPEGEDTKDIIADKDQAMAEVRDMIKGTFFESSIQPPKPGEPDGWDKATRLANTLGALPLTSAAGAMGGFSYKKVDLTRIDKKTLNVDISERTTVLRTIHPQGHLAGLFHVLRDQGLPLDRFVLSVDLDDPWFERRQVEVISRASFEDDAILSIDVTVRYNGEPRTVLLESSTARATVDWPSVVRDGRLERDATYSYKVTFKGADRSQRPVELATDELPLSEDKLEIVPRDLLYAIVQVPVVALNIPWDRYPVIEVQCRYRDAANGVAEDQVYLLDAQHTYTTWPVFLRDPAKKSFDYKVIYRAADNRDAEMPWVTSDEGFVTLRDPFPAKRTLAVVPQLNWNAVDRAFVDLSYQDGNGGRSDGSFELSAADRGTKTFTVDLKDPDRRQIDYEVTILFTDGRMAKVPSSSTIEPRLFITADMRGRRLVPVRPADADFAARHLTALDVDLRYQDPAHGLAAADSLTFKSAADKGLFAFDYVDPEKSGLEYKTTAHYDNGLSREGDWTAFGGAELVLPVA